MSDNILAEYDAFLKSKIKLAQRKGFDVPLEQINTGLKPHTRDIVRWALAGGQRAVFASFGLHKTATDSVHYCKAMEKGVSMPGLFDVLDAEAMADEENAS